MAPCRTIRCCALLSLSYAACIKNNPNYHGSYTIGGTVSALAPGASVVLTDSAAGTITVSVNGAFTLPTKLASGAAYSVSVQKQPVGQSCSIGNAMGTVSGNVTSVVVNCASAQFTVGGTVTGLDGSLTLDNGSDATTLTADGKFTFTTPVAQGAAYDVLIQSKPARQTCTIANAMGTVGNANVTNVVVTCASHAYTIGGTVSGLVGHVVLQNTGGELETIASDGPFMFTMPIADGTNYTVTVATQPTLEACTIASATGTVAGANVTNVTVTCSVDVHTVGGQISGQSGPLTLLDNGGDKLDVDGAATSFTFATPLANGAHYDVTIGQPPAGQTCSVSNEMGNIAGMNVTTVVVQCNAQSAGYIISGSITGLTADGLVLENNGGDGFSVASGSTSFMFDMPVAPGGSYDVTILTQPTGLSCGVSGAMGTNVQSNINTVSIACSPLAYTIGGMISGLKTKGLVLVDNGTDILVVPADTTLFHFGQTVPYGGNYAVTIKTQPNAAVCKLTNDTGTNIMADVTDVMVSCTP